MMQTTTRKSEWFNEECKKIKADFLNAKRIKNLNPSDENKTHFLTCRSIYAKAKRKAKLKYYCKEKQKLSNLSKTAPRNFWKYIKKYKNKKVCDMDNMNINNLVEHFQNLSNTPHEHQEYEDSVYNDVQIDALDAPFTVEEISKTISTLKRHKSADLENNVADFFIDANAFISPYLLHVFNRIFDTGIYPESWCKGIIVPIHKKGDKSNPANYRGITLVNIMAKIFSLVLRNRISKWCESTYVFNDSQFGFRDKRSTSDAIFILHTIIQKVLSRNRKLWCVFVDYEKAFDTVIRDALWIKLVETGVSCKMINIIKTIYENVKSCVKLSVNMDNSEFFDVTLGLKQGEPLSPILFILFVNDITNCVDLESLNNDDLNLLSIYMILFADDIVLFTTDPLTLNSQLNNLSDYSKKW
jgi:hypothetical protein